MCLCGWRRRHRKRQLPGSWLILSLTLLIVALALVCSFLGTQ